MSLRRPNILLITSDQQHYSTLGSVNPEIRTPALDRLCAEGTRFDRAYCPNPTCTPSRASILTGLYPSQHGAWSLGTRLSEKVPTLGALLGGAGYRTALVGKAHLQPLASRPGAESIECQPLLRDLDFWRSWWGPWYGFEHVETARMHAAESHVGGHYAVWMEERGLANWRDHFEDYPANPEKTRRIYSSREWSLPEDFHYNRWTSERTIAAMDSAGEEPFFVWSSFHDPHPPYLVPAPWSRMYDPATMRPGRMEPGEHDRNPPHFRQALVDDPDYWKRAARGQPIHGAWYQARDEATLRADMACYYGMVSFMDREIGRILDHLDASGRADDTIVVFTSDHGHFLGQHGLTAKAIHMYEDVLRVPFVVRWPGRVPAGRARGALQSLVDLAPTLLSAAGLPVPHAMSGVDQLSCWGGGEPLRRSAVVENHHGTGCFHMRTLVTTTHKITVYHEGGDGELFDLEADPGELRNLWHEPAAQATKSRLLLEFMQACMRDESLPMPRIAPA